MRHPLDWMLNFSFAMLHLIVIGILYILYVLSKLHVYEMNLWRIDMHNLFVYDTGYLSPHSTV
jgi:hypothetical protein